MDMAVVKFSAEHHDSISKFLLILLLFSFFHHRHVFCFKCGKVNFFPFLKNIVFVHILNQ